MDEECKGGFLFISHSHKDMDKVRQLRNRLEDAGYEPLCFYLKALDSGGEELDNLIKREIDARQWFVYALSENARQSEWVQNERKWRKRKASNNRQELKVDLESDVSIEEISNILIRDLRVYIIYAHRDFEFVNRLACKLKKKDLQVTTDRDLPIGKSWGEGLAELIENAAEAGTNIVVLSKNSMHSKPVLDDVKLARSRGRLIAVYIDDVELEGPLESYLHDVEAIMPRKPIGDENDLDAFVDLVVDEISRALGDKFN